MKKQYRVTYDSLEETFLVHCEAAGLPNLLFKEHGNGLHFFDPWQVDFAFLKTVESNMWNQAAGRACGQGMQPFLLALDSPPKKTSCGF
jgi:hypothetical protein